MYFVITSKWILTKYIVTDKCVCITWLNPVTSLRRLWSPRGPAPPQPPRSPSPQGPSAWPAPPFWGATHWIAAPSSEGCGFLCGSKTVQCYCVMFKPLFLKCKEYELSLTFRSVRHSEGADDFADAVLRANAVGSHVTALDDLCRGDFGVWRLCSNEWG